MTIPIAAEIETLISPWIAKKEHINLVIGVIRGDEHWIKGWGTLNPFTEYSYPIASDPIPPDGNTLFEIGSITKVFTATLLSLLVEHQELELTTPINQLGSSYQKLPDTVTLESLATHTSGLPRLPDNLKKSYHQDPQNPYAAYTIEELHEYLQSHDGEPGQTAGIIEYSNLGVGLLGNILADKYGQSYEDAMLQQICNPLALSDTCITLNQEQQTRFALGYLENGKSTKTWDLPTLAGAGALRSTANDLLKFLVAHLQPGETPIAQAIRNTHTLRHETFASTKGFLGLVGGVAEWVQRSRGGPLVQMDMKGIALGWHIANLPAIDRNVYWHNGGTGGYRSFCGFIQETQTGIVVLSNYAEIMSSMFGRYSIDTIGFKILESISAKTQSRQQAAGFENTKDAILNAGS